MNVVNPSSAAAYWGRGLSYRTYAALAVQAGANVKVLQKAMGHSDIRLTLDTYGGLFGDDLDALAASMDEAATQRVPSTNGSKMVPLAVSVDV